MYLGIDPGKDKTGWAMVDEKGGLIASGIIRGFSHSHLAEVVKAGELGLFKKSRIEGSLEAAGALRYKKLLVGSGTTSRYLIQELSNRGVPFELVDESDTTLIARSLYWKIHPPGLIRRALPFLLQLTPRDLDDLAAWQIVIRYIRERESIE